MWPVPRSGLFGSLEPGFPSLIPLPAVVVMWELCCVEIKSWGWLSGSPSPVLSHILVIWYIFVNPCAEKCFQSWSESLF